MHTVRTGLLVACCLVAAVCPPALADPAPSAGEVAKARAAVRHSSKELGAANARLAEAKSRLDDLDAQAERLVETYNGELVRLASAKTAYESARARVAEADARVALARQDVAMIAAESYGSMILVQPVVGMINSGAEPGAFLHQASVLEQIGGERGLILQRMNDAQEVSDILRGQAEDAYTGQQTASERAERAKAAAEKAVAEQTRETKVILAERKDLQQKVDSARSTADRLARERAAAQESARMKAPSWLPLSSGSRMGDVAANWALTQLGKPYVWAADGPSSYDCSGLTMRAWEKVGISMDHWTGTQWTSGPHVPLNQLRRGDLLFFGYVTSDPGTIHHVGMYVGRGLMVHAPQTGDVVRIASMWRRDLVGATRPG